MSSERGQHMIDRLLMQFANSPYLHGLLNALGTELDLLVQVFDDLKNKRWIDTGEGQQLDGCGEIVVQPRRIGKAIAIPFFGFDDQPGATGFEQGRFRDDREAYLASATLADAEYRQILWAKVAINTTDGTAESTIDSLRRLYNARIVLANVGNAKMWISIGRQLTEAEILLANALDLFVVAGGVNIEVKSWFVDGATFGFDDQNMGYVGFDDGMMAEEF